MLEEVICVTRAVKYERDDVLHKEEKKRGSGQKKWQGALIVSG